MTYSLVDKPCHLLYWCADEWAVCSTGLISGPNLKVADSFLQILHKFVKDSIVHKNTIGADTGLSTALEYVYDHLSNDKVAVSIVKIYKNGITTQFHLGRLSFLIVQLDCAMSNLPTLVEPVEEIFRITLGVQSS
jgi:hypothetical protein